jgi:hypothetical protein
MAILDIYGVICFSVWNGAVLTKVMHDKTERHVVQCSSFLTTEKKYSQIDKEALAFLVWGA